MTDSSFVVLIQNISLLLATAVVFDLLVSNKKRSRSLFWRILFGLLLGGIGITLMLSPSIYDVGIIFDTRSVLLGISGLFFGSVPTIVAMLVTAAFRYYLGGQAAWTGICVIIASGTIGILWRYLRKNQTAFVRGWQLYLFGWAIHIVMLLLMFTLPMPSALKILAKITFPVLAIYPFGTLLLGLIFVNRLKRENAIADLDRNEIRMKKQVEILQYPVESVQVFLDFSLDQAILLTNSKIGYIYFYSEDRKEFVLNSWSRAVMEECKVQDPKTCYELEKTGLWGETVRQKKPIILNDFEETNPLKKGYPEGHVKLQRFLTVPVISDGHIVAVVGVANKESDYEESDVLSLTLLMDGVWKATKRKQIEFALRESEERYAAITKNLPFGIIHIMDREFRYLYNAGDELAKVGLTNEMLVGKTIFEVLGHPLGEMVAEQYQLVLNGETVRFEGDYGGQSFFINAGPLRDEKGNIDRILALSVNITERKQMENKLLKTQAELLQSLDEMNQSRRALLSLTEDQRLVEDKIRELNLNLEQHVAARTAQLESTNQELEAFAYSVSHDLRAPLRSLEGFTGALLSDYQSKLDDQGKHYLGRIQEASRRMSHLIDDLLNLSRINRYEMKLETVDLSSTAQRIAGELAVQAPERVVLFKIAPNLVVKADKKLMDIAMENLLNNAFKFTSKQESAVIQVGVIKKAGKKTFYVRDNGVGFDMTYSEKLFTPFQRLHSTQDYPGTGIGLVIVKRIITKHGGRVWTEAEVNKGATFYFTMEVQNEK